MDKKLHVNIQVNGKVQGVFFRASTKQKADELGLSGFVRNEQNGSVYIEAEGPGTHVKELINWCKKGPEMAAVTEIIVTESSLKKFTRFELRRF